MFMEKPTNACYFKLCMISVRSELHENRKLRDGEERILNRWWAESKCIQKLERVVPKSMWTLKPHFKMYECPYTRYVWFPTYFKNIFFYVL